MWEVLARTILYVWLRTAIRGKMEQEWKRGDFVGSKKPTFRISREFADLDLMVFESVTTEVLRQWRKEPIGLNGFAGRRLLRAALADRPKIGPVEGPIGWAVHIIFGMKMLDALFVPLRANLRVTRSIRDPDLAVGA